NCHSSKAILLAKSFPLFFNQSIEFLFSQGDPSCKRNKMPAQATGGSKRVPSVGGGTEREVLKIDRPRKVRVNLLRRTIKFRVEAKEKSN
ncbi:hypothetical protein EE612_043679, partial [Oryza sativa]